VTATNGEVLQLNVEDPHQIERLRAAWPVGRPVLVRVQAGSSFAWQADDSRLHFYMAIELTGLQL
jgi:hypothetical protein